jgi:uncharacterized protein YutE (UPF0331/DUF86 family)
MNPSESSEADVLENVLPRYEAEGFQVFLQPSPSILPPFMQNYRPDAVALRGDKKIAIEVVRPENPSSQKIKDLQSLFAKQEDWELRVLYVAPLGSQRRLEVASRAAISNAIQRVRKLRDENYLLPALVMGWAALEAIGRALHPDKLNRPQTPARLVEILASDGLLTPQEADVLRAAISFRNAAVHGDLVDEVDERTVDRVISVLDTLASFLPSDGQ